MASTAEKLDPELWEQAKADARDAFGGHSARAMQLAVKLYKQRGGRYRGPKKKDNRLTQWSRQDWKTKSGRPSRETGERYLPAAAIESLTPAEYGATTRAKRRGGGVGSVVAQPQSIREKTRKFRKVNPDMATAKQIAARKKFAERARSGELARMRKKNPAKKPTRATSRKANPRKRDALTDYFKQMNIEDFKDRLLENEDQNLHGENVVMLARRYGGEKTISDAEIILKKQDLAGYLTPELADARRKLEVRLFPKYENELSEYIKATVKRNPTATRVASRKANPVYDRDGFYKFLITPTGAIAYEYKNNQGYTDTGFSIFQAKDKTEVYDRFTQKYVEMPKNRYSIASISKRDDFLNDLIAVTKIEDLKDRDERVEISVAKMFGIEGILTPRRRNPTATRPGRSRTKLVSNGGRKSNPATKDVFFVNVIDDGGFQFGMDDRTPVLFKFSNREMKKGVYRSFALPFNVTSNPEFQNFVKNLPGNQIVISLKDLRKQLSAYA